MLPMAQGKPAMAYSEECCLASCHICGWWAYILGIENSTSKASNPQRYGRKHGFFTCLNHVFSERPSNVYPLPKYQKDVDKRSEIGVVLTRSCPRINFSCMPTSKHWLCIQSLVKVLKLCIGQAKTMSKHIVEMMGISKIRMGNICTNMSVLGVLDV